jgi:hypothetical protein
MLFLTVRDHIGISDVDISNDLTSKMPVDVIDSEIIRDVDETSPHRTGASSAIFSTAPACQTKQKRPSLRTYFIHFISVDAERLHLAYIAASDVNAWQKIVSPGFWS